MLREIVGASTLATWLMPDKKRHHKKMPIMSTTTVLAGLGVGAYLLYRNQMNKNSHSHSGDNAGTEE